MLKGIQQIKIHFKWPADHLKALEHNTEESSPYRALVYTLPYLKGWEVGEIDKK